MPKPFFDLDRVDADALRRVGATLRSVGYTEDGVRERLQLEDITALKLSRYPYYFKYRLRRRDARDVAISLFLLQGTVPEEELAELFDRPGRRVLRQLRVLMRDRTDRTVRSRLSLYPVGEQLFFTDHRHAHQDWVRAREPRDPVMYLGADSYFLARTTLRRPARSALDLCSGSGVHGVLAAGQTERVVGVDVNPRAVNFGRLNALLNDTWNVVFVEGDLFAPLGGERFDLILANPPFVPAPVYEVTYRDGGPSGADVLRRIVSALPDHLTSGGLAQVVTHVAEREGESYLERIRRWLGGANMNLHSVRVGTEDVVDYAVSQTQRTFGEDYARYAPRLVDWITNMRSQRFTRVVGVVLTFQWNEDAPHAPWTQEDEAKPPLLGVDQELGRLLRARSRARRLPLPALDRMRVGVPDDLLLIERRRPGGDGLETRDYRVQFRSARLSPELEIKPLVRDILEAVDNRSTVPQVLARVAQAQGKPPVDLDERGRRAVLVMLERGLITLDEVDAPAPPPAARPEPAAARDDEVVGPVRRPERAGSADEADPVPGGLEALMVSEDPDGVRLTGANPQLDPARDDAVGG